MACWLSTLLAVYQLDDRRLQLPHTVQIADERRFPYLILLIETSLYAHGRFERLRGVPSCLQSRATTRSRSILSRSSKRRSNIMTRMHLPSGQRVQLHIRVCSDGPVTRFSQQMSRCLKGQRDKLKLGPTYKNMEKVQYSIKSVSRIIWASIALQQLSHLLFLESTIERIAAGARASVPVTMCPSCTPLQSIELSSANAARRVMFGVFHEYSTFLNFTQLFRSPKSQKRSTSLQLQSFHNY